MDKFEQWFINQDFYTNMRFIHGDALFIKDRDVYRVLPVQMTWVAWQSRQAEVDALKNQLIKAGFKDRGGQLLVPPHGKPPRFDLLDAKQAEVDEKDKRIKEALVELESLHDKKWAEWKEQADMHSQGEANAYEHAMRILEKALRGEHE